MEIISKIDGIDFGVTTKFKSEYIKPRIQNLLFKAENG